MAGATELNNLKALKCPGIDLTITFLCMFLIEVNIFIFSEHILVSHIKARSV